MLQGFQGLQPLLGQLRRFGVVDLLEMLFCGVFHKDIKEVAVTVGMNKMSIVLNPPDGPVLPYNAVFHLVQIVAVCKNLLFDAPLGFFYVLWVNQPMKRITGVLLKFF